MLENGHGKDCIKRRVGERRYSRPKIFPDDFDLWEAFDVAIVVGRAIAKSIIRIDEGDVVTEFGEKTADDRLATADLKEARGWRYRAEDRFDGPGPLDIFQVAIERRNLRKFIPAFAKVANRSIRDSDGAVGFRETLDDGRRRG
ncbi:MAG: hypothetical protein QOF24_3102 [Verrucomicrobiota bacterium]